MTKNLEQFLFYFLFFAIPFQTRKILYYPGWQFNEWQSVSVYFTDVLLLMLVCYWLYYVFVKKKLRIKDYELQTHDYFLLAFLATSGIAVKNSSDFYVGLFLWLKLVEFAFFYFYLKFYAVNPVRGKAPLKEIASADHALWAGRTSNGIDFIKIIYALILGGAFQAIVGIVQFLKQSDLSLRLLGESILGSDMPGIASFFVASGEKIIRAYGTTPHPNILAAYLLLSIFAIYFLYIYKNKNERFYDSFLPAEASAQAGIYHKIIKYWWVWYSLMLFGLFFTFSRAIIFIWVVGLLARIFLIASRSKFRKQFWQNQVLKTRLIQIGLVTIGTIIIFSLIYWPEVSSRLKISSDEEAVQLRVFYNKESIHGGINLFGIGLGDYTSWLMEKNPNLPRHVYQPVHNIYLLIYSEIGILGLIFFLLFLAGLFYEFIKKTKLLELKHYSFLLIVSSILFIGLFDHFLFTIQQGRFILWMSLTLLVTSDTILSKPKEED